MDATILRLDEARPALTVGGLVVYQRPLDNYSWLGRIACLLEPPDSMPLALVMSRHTDGFPVRPVLTPVDRLWLVPGNATHSLSQGQCVYRVAQALAGRQFTVESFLSPRPIRLFRVQVDCVGCHWLGGHDDELHAVDLHYRLRDRATGKMEIAAECELAVWVASAAQEVVA